MNMHKYKLVHCLTQSYPLYIWYETG